MALNVVYIAMQSGRASNGGLVSLGNLLQHLTAGTTATVVTQRSTPLSDRWQSQGVEVVVLPNLADGGGTFLGRSPRCWRSRAGAIAQLRGLLARRAPHVVHANDIQALFAAAAARPAGTPLLFNVRGVKRPDERYGPPWRLAMSLASRVMVLSEEMRDQLARRAPTLLGRTPAIDVAYSGVDLRRFVPTTEEATRAARRNLGLPELGAVVTQVGAFWSLKRQRELIETMQPSLRDGTIARLAFVGDFAPERDPYAGSCAELAVRLGVADRVVFAGATRDVPAWLAASDVVVVASKREGLSRSMIEGMATATPVVSYDVCSARELLDRPGEAAGVVIANGDWAALRAAIEDLVRDPARRRALGLAGRRIAELDLDPETSASKYERVYQELAA